MKKMHHSVGKKPFTDDHFNKLNSSTTLSDLSMESNKQKKVAQIVHHLTS